MRISRAEPELPAAKAGVAVGDMVLAVDGRDVAGPGDVGVRRLIEREPGTEVRLLVRSGEQPAREVKVVLAAPNR